MYLAKGTKSESKAFDPSVVLEFEAEGWVWESSTLNSLRAGLVGAAGDHWLLRGPALLRDDCCAIRFEPSEAGRLPSRSALLSAIEAVPCPDAVVAKVPAEDRRLVELRTTSLAVTLRSFPRGQRDPHDEEVPAQWISLVVDAMQERLGVPDAVAFGAFRSSPVDRAASVVSAVTNLAGGGPSRAGVWWGDCGGAMVGVTAGGGFQAALVGECLGGDMVKAAGWLRGVGLDLAESVDEPAYSRVSIEPTGLGAFGPYSRMQPGAPASPNPGVTERRLDEWIPDAYWWQLIDRRLVSRLSSELDARAISENLFEVALGDASDWIPTIPWLGDLDAPSVVDPPRVLTEGRALLKPLLWEI